MCDATETDLSYGHGGNSSAGKENTAPYRIGTIAPLSHMNIKDHVDVINQVETYKVHWLDRVKSWFKRWF